jgi:chloride channel 2
VPGYLGWRTLVAKVVGLTLALGSSLPVGKEGPFVHIASSVAFQLLQLPCFSSVYDCEMLTHHTLAAASAVGVSSTFGTPVGGVLFAVEVMSTYVTVSSYWKGFFAAVCGAFVFRELAVYGSSRLNITAVFQTGFTLAPWSSVELLLFALLAVISGVASAYYVRFHTAVVRLRRRYQQRYIGRNPFVLAAIVAAAVALCTFPFGDFMTLSIHETIDDLFHEGALSERSLLHAQNWTPVATNATLAAADAAAGLAVSSVVRGEGDSVVELLPAGVYNTDTNPFYALFVFILVRFASSAVSIGLALPAGVFTPAFAVGAGVGRLVGEILPRIGVAIVPGGYALVGAAAFISGATGTISTAIMVFELTSQLSYMLPVLLSVLIARAVASRISPSIYETIGRDKGLPVMPTVTRQRSYHMRAGDVV